MATAPARNLAAVVALMARDRGGPKLRLQSLVYPVADYTLSTPSYETYAEGYGLLTRAAMQWFQRHYLRSLGRRRGLARLADQGAEPRRGRAGDRRHRRVRRAAR